MLSTKEIFYVLEPVWIVRPENKGSDKDESISEKGPEKVRYPIYTSIPYHLGYYNYNPEYTPSPGPAEEDHYGKGKIDSNGTEKKKETTFMMKVPMCCGECEATVKVALYELEGVKSVECDSLKERVTVVATTAALADMLMKCKNIFKKSRMWSDED